MSKLPLPCCNNQVVSLSVDSQEKQYYKAPAERGTPDTKAF